MGRELPVPQPELDFAEQFGLPVGRQTFTLKQLADCLGTSLNTMYRLHQEGAFTLPNGESGTVNLAPRHTQTRGLIRVSRAAALHMLRSRQD